MAKALRIALIGCGGIQGKHLHTFHTRPDTEIVALADSSIEQCERFAARHQIDRWKQAPSMHDDLEAMYRAVQPDAVCIATPHTLHFDQAMQAIKAGCHVLLEKPMVTSATDARTLAQAVQASGRVLAVAYNTSCKPEVHYLRQLIRDKQLGNLELVGGWIAQSWMKLTVNLWRQIPELSGGGMAYDSGAHPLNTLCWCLESPVREVYACVENLGCAVDINAALTIRFANGVLASMTIGGNCPTNGADMAFLFDNGRVMIDPWGGDRITVFKGEEQIKYPPVANEETSPADNFIEAIAGREEVAAGTRHGIIHSDLMQAIYASAASGQPVRLDN